MSFEPGRVVTTTTTKSGDEMVIRYPQWSDLQSLTDYINTLSKENTFITFSGEQMSLEEEGSYLSGQFVKYELGDAVGLLAMVGNEIAGFCGIDRDTSGRSRSAHTAVFGISVAKDYRRQGIGEQLARRAIGEATKHINGLKTIMLTHFGLNEAAHAMYEKIGFVEHGRLPGGYKYKDIFEDKVYMHLPVDED